jgi:uncharacterized RDD family membrane protein YckC
VPAHSPHAGAYIGLRIIDGIFAYLVGFVIVLSSNRRRRLGDMAAGTLTVRA